MDHPSDTSLSQDDYLETIIVYGMQAVLGNASLSLTALVSQDLRQRNILPLALFGPEGSFSSGPQIIQAVAGILGVAIPLPALAPAPVGKSQCSRNLDFHLDSDRQLCGFQRVSIYRICPFLFVGSAVADAEMYCLQHCHRVFRRIKN